MEISLQQLEPFYSHSDLPVYCEAHTQISVDKNSHFESLRISITHRIHWGIKIDGNAFRNCTINIIIQMNNEQLNINII
jgi:hypothetical protein